MFQFLFFDECQERKLKHLSFVSALVRYSHSVYLCTSKSIENTYNSGCKRQPGKRLYNDNKQRKENNYGYIFDYDSGNGSICSFSINRYQYGNEAQQIKSCCHTKI